MNTPDTASFEVWRATDDGAECVATAPDKTAAHELMRKRGDAIVLRGDVLAVKYGLHAGSRRTIAHVAKFAPRDANGALIPPETPPPPAEEPAAHEEPVKTTDETVQDCTNCNEHPAAPPKDTTPKGEEGWCMHCRRNASIQRNRNAKPAKPPRKKAPKPARKVSKPKAPPSLKGLTAVTIVPTDAAVLDRVTRSLAVVQALGGIERAEKIAEAHAFGSGT